MTAHTIRHHYPTGNPYWMAACYHHTPAWLAEGGTHYKSEAAAQEHAAAHNNAKHPVTAATHKVVVVPVHHTKWAAGAERIVRTTWAAKVTARNDETPVAWCGHEQHRTAEAASKCGLHLFGYLERAGARP